MSAWDSSSVKILRCGKIVSFLCAPIAKISELIIYMVLMSINKFYSFRTRQTTQINKHIQTTFNLVEEATKITNTTLSIINTRQTKKKTFVYI